MVDILEEKYIRDLPEPVSLRGTKKIIKQMNNSICRIYNGNRDGTGFFVKIPYKSILLPVLITNYQVIGKNEILNNIEIYIYLNNDKKTKTLKLDTDRKIYANEKFDISIIEIKENDYELNNQFLELDDEILNCFKLAKENLNYLNNSYSNESIYILNYSMDNNDIFVSYGKLLFLRNTEILYLCNLKEGSSGSPILLTNNRKLIGIHSNNSKKYNKGNLLYYSINEFSKMKNNLLLIDKDGDLFDSNHIITEFDIKEDNKITRIINTNGRSILDKRQKGYENETEIKDNCEIRINDELIPFTYFYNFKKKGKYKIKYTFMLIITKINNLFNGCSCIKSIDFSNFNTLYITNMNSTFSECSSLESINFSHFNTNKVVDMSNLFHNCSSLTSLNLLNFNTSKVYDMSNMFSGCSSLRNINLSNFNTSNVYTMYNMFNRCSSFTSLDLSSFNTKNVITMWSMFNGCSSLTSLDLSNFNTNKVQDMTDMFAICSSLAYLDLSNFNTTNVKCSIKYMFYNCHRLKKNNVFVDDKKIKELLK